jgi:hypothetical protein
MHRQFERDPTEFFSVVGAPYVRERVGEPHSDEHGFLQGVVSAPRRRRLNIGVATVCAGLGGVLLGVSLFATNGVARLGEVAFQAAGMK